MRHCRPYGWDTWRWAKCSMRLGWRGVQISPNYGRMTAVAIQIVSRTNSGILSLVVVHLTHNRSKVWNTSMVLSSWNRVWWVCLSMRDFNSWINRPYRKRDKLRLGHKNLTYHNTTQDNIPFLFVLPCMFFCIYWTARSKISAFSSLGFCKRWRAKEQKRITTKKNDV